MIEFGSIQIKAACNPKELGWSTAAQNALNYPSSPYSEKEG